MALRKLQRPPLNRTINSARSDELTRLEDDVRRPVPPAVLQAIEKTPVVEAREPIGRDGRARGVAAQALEAAAVSRGNGHVCMQAYASGAGAALALERREVVRVDLVAEAQHAPSCAVAGGDSPRDRGAVQLRQEGLLLGQWIPLPRIRLGAEAAALEQACEAPRDLAHHASDLGILRRRERVEARRLEPVRLVDTVEHKRVEVDVQVESVAEPLHERDGAALGALDAPLFPGPAPERCEDGPHEDTKHGGRECGVVGEAVAERVGEREHPLADGGLGEHAIDQVSCGVGHAAPPATKRGTWRSRACACTRKLSSSRWTTP
jgi:hypothetical protein